MNKRLTRWLVYTAIIALTLFSMTLIQHNNPVSPRGIYLPLQQNNRHVDPSQVTLFSADRGSLPAALGTINVSIRMVTDNPKDIQSMMQKYLTTTAAANGANSLVILSGGYSIPSKVTNGLAMYQLSANTYYVNSVRQLSHKD